MTGSPTNHDEDWEDHDEDMDMENQDSGDEADGDEDNDEILQRLNAKLWADINAATADMAGNTPQPNASLAGQTTRFEKAQAAIVTMKSILAILEADPFAKSVLKQACLPDSPGQNVLDLLTGAVATGTIFDGIAQPLSNVLRTLSQSDALTVTTTEPSSSILKGKRKRGDLEEDVRSSKRVGLDSQDLQTQISAAIHFVSEKLGENSESALDASTVYSIQMPLYQIYLFSVTASAIVGQQSNALQELSGLIQLVGVISGVQITAPISVLPSLAGSDSNDSKMVLTWHPSTQSRLSDIGTAVYPCLVPSCRKTFSRLYSLRTHRQSMHVGDDVLRCETCSVLFATQYELKKHVKEHTKKVWRCAGCQKTFARKDGIKRHQKTADSRKDKDNDNDNDQSSKCAAAEVEEVEVSLAETSDPSPRPPKAPAILEGTLEEGEIPQDIISLTQNAVLELQDMLASRVTKALGTRELQSNKGEQVALTSMIARAQGIDVNTKPASGINANPYGLSDEETQMLQAAVDAAKAQAEAEAQLELEIEEAEAEDEGEADADDGGASPS